MKLWNYMVILTTFILFLEFVGIPTGLSIILNTFGVEINPTTSELISADLEGSSFFAQIFGAAGILILIGTGAAVIVGTLTRTFDKQLVVLPLLITIATLYASTFWAVIKYVQNFGQSWATNIVALVFIGLGVGFIMACVDYFVGVE